MSPRSFNDLVRQIRSGTCAQNRESLVAQFAEVARVSVHTVESWLKDHATDPVQSVGASTGINLTARIDRDRHGQPLVTLPDRPFNGLDIHPADLERLGERLIAIARLAKQHKGKHPSTVVMG